MTLYATYFDSNFLARGLACLQSIVTHSENKPRFLILALDQTCVTSIGRLRNVLDEIDIEIITPDAIERQHPHLKELKSSRTTIEYFFTLTPYLCSEAVRRVSEGELAIYVDADLYFFADPSLMLSDVEDTSVILVEHRFHAGLPKHSELYGRFNVGWIGFRRTHDAELCLRQWSTRCSEWCHDYVSAGRFADQKYLDEWPTIIKTLKIVTNPGANLAPWNVARHKLSLSPGGFVLADGQRLIFYHFHHLRRMSQRVYETDFGELGRVTTMLADRIYQPYLDALARIELAITAELGKSPRGELYRFRLQKTQGLRSIAHLALRYLRLFTRRRVIFHDGRRWPIWKAALYD